MQNSIGDQTMNKRPNDAQSEKQKREAIQASRFVLGPLFCEVRIGLERIGIVRRANDLRFTRLAAAGNQPRQATNPEARKRLEKRRAQPGWVQTRVRWAG
jgi:hypothetical protein